MIPELGHFSLILALMLSLLLASLPLYGVRSGNVRWMSVGASLASGIFVFVALAFACLTYAFLVSDFSVAYVARNSNTLLPVFYKFSAVWGAHEGSFLLWVMVMAGWTFAVSIFSRGLPLDIRARVLAIMGILQVGFLLFLLLTSNPFDRTLPIFPAEGNDLNPLLQDIGLIVHPPLLFMGYVGFSVPFAFAIAALMSGRLDAAWARWSRPWTNTAWAFLGAGIMLGSWWAYYELGWGGWWFWDAVENASFMPWIVGTALLHSLAVSEKRGVFRAWTVLLAIFAFSLSLLGAFLVRSGVLTSVHAFAVDPTRGLFILGFLVMVIGGSLTLFAFRVADIKSTIGFETISRESFMLVNNVLLVVAAAAVLLGTIYPLIFEALSGGEKISVGPPYFNTVFVPLILLLMVFMAAAPDTHWRSVDLRRLLLRHIPLAVGSEVVVVALMLAYGVEFDLKLNLAVALSLWVTIGLLLDAVRQVRNKQGLADKVAALFRQTPSYYGMWLSHFGLAVVVSGVALTSYLSVAKDVRLAPGETVTIADLQIQMLAMRKVKGPNYMSDQGDFEVRRDGRYLFNLKPEKRYYADSGNPMTEAAIDPGFFRDLFVALGEPVGADNAWAVRVHYKPFVRWIWGGGLIVSIGGLITLFDRRYRLAGRRRAVTETTALAAPAS